MTSVPGQPLNLNAFGTKLSGLPQGRWPRHPSDPCGPHRLVSERWQDNGLLHGVHDQLPQLLQYPLQHRLLADFGKESQAGGEEQI